MSGEVGDARKRDVPEKEAWVPIFLNWLEVGGGQLDFQGLPVPPVLEDMLEAYHYYPKHH